MPCRVVLADGAFVDATDARVSVFANALSYGTGTFEGIRAFWNASDEQLYLLEAHAHYERMHRSARILGLPLPYTTRQLVELTAELLRRNQVTTDAYVRPLLFLSGEVLPVRMAEPPPSSPQSPTSTAGQSAPAPPAPPPSACVTPSSPSPPYKPQPPGVDHTGLPIRRRRELAATQAMIITPIGWSQAEADFDQFLANSETHPP